MNSTATGSYLPSQGVLLLRSRTKNWGRNTYSTQPCYLQQNETKISRVCESIGRTWTDLHKSARWRRWSFIPNRSWMGLHIFDQRQNHSCREVCDNFLAYFTFYLLFLIEIRNNFFYVRIHILNKDFNFCLRILKGKLTKIADPINQILFLAKPSSENSQKFKQKIEFLCRNLISGKK